MEETRRDELDQESNRPELTVVYVSQGLLPAQVVKTKLETADIPVMLSYESLGPILGITVDGLGEVRVLVPAGCADEARAIIEEVEEEAESQPPAANHSVSDKG